MSGLSQNSSYESQAIYLEPNQNLIDGRTELDHLHFMARFASVLNFYNQANKLDGNWQPFLLKDPAILMAFISKTDLNPFKNNFEAASKGLDFFGYKEQSTSQEKQLPIIFCAHRQYLPGNRDGSFFEA